ncbi:MAG: hypothetical protein KDD69_14955 [Bdellovibrionales bacterium]|nr:hypothetical protein [Bdellovibrionales bacterium]
MNSLTIPRRSRYVATAALAAVCVLLDASHALAQSDPFLAVEDEGDAEARTRELDEAQTFTGSIERLMKMAGEDTTDPGHWSEFENVKGTPVEERYHTSYEWRMRKELAEPLPERRHFGSSLEDIEKELDVLRPTEKRRQREHMMEHY